MIYSLKKFSRIRLNDPKDYKQCSVTLMDSSDPDITFNEKG